MIDYNNLIKWNKMSMFLAGKPRNSKQPKGMCALKISPHSFIAVTLEMAVGQSWKSKKTP